MSKVLDCIGVLACVVLSVGAFRAGSYFAGFGLGSFATASAAITISGWRAALTPAEYDKDTTR